MDSKPNNNKRYVLLVIASAIGGGIYITGEIKGHGHLTGADWLAIAIGSPILLCLIAIAIKVTWKTDQ